MPRGIPLRDAAGGSAIRVHEAGAVGERDGLHAVAQPQLGEDVVDVGLDGGFAEEERGGDLGVGMSVGD